MPSPRNDAMFSTKIDMSVACATTNTSASVVTTLSAPIATGSPAATTLPNTSSSRMASNGMVMSSAR